MSLTILGILLFIFILAFVIFYLWASSGTIEQEKLSEIITYPTAPQASASGEVFTIMTYNIGYLSGMTNNLAVHPKEEFFQENMETFLQLLKTIQVDFIGFQEMDFHSARSYYVDQLRFIAEKAGYTYAARAVNWDKRYVPFPYWPLSMHFGRILSGQAVLSRWPIQTTERIILEKPKNKPFYYNAFYLDRLVQTVQIKIADQEIVILNVHLEAFEQETRENQAKVVLNLYKSFKDRYPTLLIGDFNSVSPHSARKKDFPDEPESDFSNDKTLQLFLEETSLKAAELDTLTFPSDHPTRKLDYIFYNHEKINLIKTFVPVIDSSDHLPVVVQFSIK